MNPMETLKQFIGRGATPQQILSNIPNNSNPMIKQLMQMASSGNMDGIETFARNLFKERGRDFDKEFSEFMTQIKR